MIPISLEMSAFGPFADKTQIDMSKLGKSGVYLITGDTGAGKTTIFDAISFALYGEPSGVNRRTDMLRSDYASPMTPTYVTLRFEYAGREYTVTRNPEYIRPKKNGSGETRENKAAELTMPDGMIISGWSEVTRKVAELIGVERERFNKIAMIAQGDFQKLLFADTKERMPLFRKIFGTQKYDRLQNEIRDFYFGIKTEYASVSDRIRQLTESVVCEKTNKNYDTLEEIKQNGCARAEIIIELVDTLVKQDGEIIMLLDADIKAKEEQSAQLNNRLGAAKAANAELLHAKETEQKVRTAETDCADAEKRLCLAQDQNRFAGEIGDRIAKIKSELPEYDEADGLMKEIAQLNNKIGELTADIQDIEAQQKSLSEQLNKLNALKADEAWLRTEQLRLRHSGDKLSERLAVLGELGLALDKYNKLKPITIQAKKAYETAAAEYERAKDKYEQDSRAYLDEQAGVLAQSLKAGKPCPVCGSVEHPAPAALRNSAPSKEQIDDLKNICDAAEKLRQKKSDEAGKMREQLSLIVAKIMESANRLFGEFEQKKLPQMIISENKMARESADAAKKELESVEKRLEEIGRAENITVQINEQLSALTRKHESDSALIFSMRASAQEKRTRHDKLVSKLSFKTKHDALAAVDDAQNRLDEILLNLKNAEKRYDHAKNLLSSLSGKLEGLKSIRQAENAEKLEAELGDVLKSIAMLREKRDEVSNRVSLNSKALIGIKKYFERLADCGKRMVSAERLYSAASGTVSGKRKLSLEAFVQAAYFDKILRKANLRLLKMSSGRYEMVRCTDADKLNSQTGLEIDVVDHYTGGRRKVKSLSGGESFMASLSLALGLSDEIQSNAGGIHLDCMFIDEGFGSLDETTLSLAMNAFSGLSGGRLIGIISHVSELKERIDRKILVEKHKTGSTVRIICN